MFGGESQKYQYKCVCCEDEIEVEDIIFDAYFHSQNCKEGESPILTCPECNAQMKCITN
jgi:predicted nucleic acid-binding Zn ribbon protein